VKANRDDIKAIRDANHQWWTGDGEDFEGFESWMNGRYVSLAPTEESPTFQLLMSNLAECDTPAGLQNLVAMHGDVIDTLDGEESTRFTKAFDEREASFKPNLLHGG